jgi:periplasmic divalent cation tolerance protein
LLSPESQSKFPARSRLMLASPSQVSCVAYAVNMTDTRVWSVTSTVPTQAQALELARVVVKERLAAGAEVTGPATSVFWHLGELGEGEEWRVTLRTAAGVRDALAARLSDLHPWDSPEVSATPLTWCTESYAAWVERTTAASEPAE